MSQSALALVDEDECSSETSVAVDAPTLIAVLNDHGKATFELVGDDPIRALSIALDADERGVVSYESIKSIEAFFREYGDTCSPPLVHRFCDGLYSREITMPAGGVIISRMHKKDNIAIISKGRVTVWSEEGRQDIVAPFTMITRPGAKRVLYIHEECVWTTVHATDAKELELVETLLSVDPEDERSFKASLSGELS